jgi:predicted PurR-regulated permease PerM
MAFLPPSQQPFNWRFRRVVWATLVIVIVALSVWALYRSNQVIFLVCIAIVLGTVTRPVAAWLHRRKIPLLVAAILVYLLLLTFVAGFVVLLFPLVADQGGEIASSLPGYFKGLCEWLLNNSNLLVVRLGEFLPSTLSSLQPVQQTGSQMLATAGQVLGYVTTAANTIFTVTAVLLLAFYWTLLGTQTIQSLLLLIPHNKRENISELISIMETKLSSYLAGQTVLCVVIGALTLVAYLLIGLPNAFVLALGAGLF